MSHNKQRAGTLFPSSEWRQALDDEMVLGRPSTRISLPMGTATTTTLAWTEPWARLRPSPQHELCLWARLRPSPQRNANRKKWLFSLDRLVEEEVLNLDLFLTRLQGHMVSLNNNWPKFPKRELCLPWQRQIALSLLICQSFCTFPPHRFRVFLKARLKRSTLGFLKHEASLEL